MDGRTTDVVYQPHNSSIANMDARYMVLICYLGPILIGLIPNVGWFLAWALPLVILFMEKSSRLVRFSAAQSLVISIAAALLQLVLVILSVPLTLITLGLWVILAMLLYWVISVGAWVLLGLAAYKGYTKWVAWEAPVLGRWAHKLEQKIQPAA